MYILKNAFRNLIRGKGKNILMGIIITIITISGCIAISINKSSVALKKSYIEENELEVSFSLDPSSLRNADEDEKTSFSTIDVDLVNSIEESNLISSYYYKLEVSMSSSDIDTVDNTTMERPNSDSTSSSTKHEMSGEKGGFDMSSIGDFKLTSYSNFSYLEDFISGTKKITSGTMINNESSDNEIIIGEDLASENDLELGDTIKVYYPGDEDAAYKLTIVGIYSDSTSLDDESSFMGMTAMSSSNQLYTNLSTINKIIDENSEEEDTSVIKMSTSNGLTAKFYLNDSASLDSFSNEAYEKGLDSHYSVTTNEDEITETLAPIINISKYSTTFLIVILVIGAIILGVINMINISNRKYEIGVLRAIGMSKIKLNLQLMLELSMVSLTFLIIGIGLGTFISQPITNYMLESEIESYKNEQTEINNNFGGGNFNMNKGEDKGMSKLVATNYVDSLKVSTDISTIFILFIVSLGLTTVTSLISSGYVNRFEPNKILQNRT